MLKKDLTKDTLDKYLTALAYEFRKLTHNQVPIELIIVGGASILLQYDFRESTLDVDCFIHMNADLKEAIKRVAYKYDLEQKWLNTDFIKTSSFSNKLIEVSKFYKSYTPAFDVRLIEGIYLIAMKMKAGRLYKHDLSDITGIIKDYFNNRIEIRLEMIEEAVIDLYGSKESVSDEIWSLVKAILNTKDLEALYKTHTQFEMTMNEFEITQFIVMDKGAQFTNREDILKAIDEQLENQKYE